ncbi:MAG: CpsD/CapB family tyrosine-protein kinase [Candidatus Omnitrophica bacterium]|nr:CpsD/CapB family tyrosine-protein kinase [Candidatus Omnitrophota bacterium]
MSKITKALEKAARERLRRRQLEETVAAASAPAQESKAVAGEKKEAAHPLPAHVSRPKMVAPEKLKFNENLKINPHIIVAADPKSPIAEQYRIVRTNLQSMKPLTEARALLVTSSVHGEGKSVTSLNLALSLAQQEGLRVLLIDADLRASTIHQWLGFTPQKGLSNALSDSGVIDPYLVNVVESKLWVLPAGPVPSHPAELLDSANMKQIIETARKQYDIVLIDSPPVLPVADPGILSRMVDGTILVVRSGKTQRATVEKTKALLKQTKAKIIGCILTHAEFFTSNYYGYSYYYPYRRRNGSSAPVSTVTNGSGTATVQPTVQESSQEAVETTVLQKTDR